MIITEPIGRHRATDPDDDQDQTDTTETQAENRLGRLSPDVAEATTWLAHDWPDPAANRRAGGEG